MPDITLYAIPQCDTVKKSRAWFDNQRLPYRFHDYKKLGVPADHWELWCRRLGCTALVNRQGTTWRKLAPQFQEAIQSDAGALGLVSAYPSVIRRPVVEWMGTNGLMVSVGWAPELWEQWRLEN